MYFNEAFNDEVYNLLKFIIEDKIFDFAEFNICDTITSSELKDISFNTDETLSKYTSMCMKYIKFFEEGFR
jgi:hypothetical protein